MDPIEELIRRALTSHGIDPDDPDIAAEIKSVMNVMVPIALTPNCPLCNQPPAQLLGVIAMCGTGDCPGLSWDVTKNIDELILTARCIRLNPEE
jgi:hypothetical protein